MKMMDRDGLPLSANIQAKIYVGDGYDIYLYTFHADSKPTILAS